MVGFGAARRGLAGMVRQDGVWRGEVRHGGAWQGRRGMDGHGTFGHGCSKVRNGRHGRAGRCEAWHGEADVAWNSERR